MPYGILSLWLLKDLCVMRAKSYSLPGHAGKQARTPVRNFMLKVLLKLQVTRDRRDTGVAAEHAVSRSVRRRKHFQNENVPYVSLRNGFVITALGRINFSRFFEGINGFGNVLAVHTEFFGHIAGTNGFPRLLHSIENLVFHGKLLFPNRNGMQIALFQSLVKLLSEHILSQNAVEQVSWPLMPELPADYGPAAPDADTAVRASWPAMSVPEHSAMEKSAGQHSIS